MAEQTGIDICALAEIEDPGSKGFVIEQGDWPLHGFVIRRDQAVFAYLNVCPHAGRMLNWGPDRFLNKDRSLIMCSAHGAIFEIDSGLCVGGPCLGDALSKLDARIENGRVVVYSGRGDPEGPG